MLCCQVIGNDAGDQPGRRFRNFQTECLQAVDRPQCVAGITPARRRHAQFRPPLRQGIEAQRERIAENLERSLMLVTALVPHIGSTNGQPGLLNRRIVKTALPSTALVGYATAEATKNWVLAGPTLMLGDRPPLNGIASAP